MVGRGERGFFDGGDDGDDAVEGGMELGGGITQGRAFAGSDLAGDDGHGGQRGGILKTFSGGLESGKGIEFVGGDILGEGLSALLDTAREPVYALWRERNKIPFRIRMRPKPRAEKEILILNIVVAIFVLIVVNSSNVG